MIKKYSTIEEAARDSQCKFINGFMDACEHVTEEVEALEMVFREGEDVEPGAYRSRNKSKGATNG